MSNSNRKIIPSKFRPSDIDPDIKIYDKAKQHNMPDFKYKHIPLPKSSSDVEIPPRANQTSQVQTVLYLLGINEKELYASHKRVGSFWKRPPEFLWRMLELAKRRHELEMAQAHPDKGGNPKRAAQLNAAWGLVRKLFAKHGFTLHT